MWQVLFTIPRTGAGMNLFGFGLLLAVWAVCSVAILAWSYRKHGWGPETMGYLPVLGVVGLAIAFVIPNLLDFEGLPIRGYGVMLLIAIVSAIGLTLYRARRVGVDPELIFSLAFWTCSAGIIGARVFYIIEYWDKFQMPTWGPTLASMINITQGGLVVYGSLLAGGAALLAFIYKHQLPGLALADLVAPGVVLGVGLGRIGCFLNGCCFGDLSDLPWAVRFPEGSPAYVAQAQKGEIYLHGLVFAGSKDDPPVIQEVESGSPALSAGLRPGDHVTRINGSAVGSVEAAQFELFKTYGAGTRLAIQVMDAREPKTWTLAATAPRSRPVHPAQLYSLIDALLLCFLLLAYEPYKRREGELTALVLTIHPITRFLLEIIRIDESAVFNTGMSISQNISIGIFAGGVLLWIYLHWSRPRQRGWSGALSPTGTT